MGYAADQPLLWPARPDWSTPVTETLAWLSDAMQAPTGGAQVRSLRAAPRRSFSFTSALDRDERRLADAIAFDVGVRPIALPIYPDVQVLAAPVAAGDGVIWCRTNGFDFADAGRALLWSAADTWEVATIDTVGDGALDLAAPLANPWPIGTRVYPLRRARLADAAKATHKSDELALLDASLLIDEPCDWPAAWPTATLYRGVAVLEWRNEESQDPADQYDRLTANSDTGTGPIYYQDSAGMPFRTQSQRFVLAGRAEHSAFRALAYMLAGRAAQCWVPSWQADVRLAAPVAASTKQISVGWMGYTAFGRQQPNRRDLAIELTDGTRLYRRITGSAGAGATEVLQLDAALGRAVAPAQVRQIGFLSLCASAADTVTIQHDTDADGVAVANLNFVALKSDV